MERAWPKGNASTHRAAVLLSHNPARLMQPHATVSASVWPGQGLSMNGWLDYGIHQAVVLLTHGKAVAGLR